MQLDKTKKISACLATATCALISAGANAQDNTKVNDWQFDTAILYYGETDRVSLLEGVVSASKDFGDQHVFSTKLVVDTLTGASASGAVAQPTMQTFTRPSGNGQYTVNPNELPLDDTFRDTRLQVSANWTQPIIQDMRATISGNLSREYDYLSIGGSTSIEKDYFNKNTTATFGVSYQYDSIDPVGGRPLGLSTMVVAEAGNLDDEDYRTAFADTRILSADTKSTLDALVGVTQVINRRMLVQLNYSYSNSNGYLNDPYKVLSLVDGNGITQSILHEQRPDKRVKHSFFAQTKYAFDGAVGDLSYRYASDDWDIQSHTVDAKLRYKLNETDYIQPHLRFYQQSAADFYRPYLLQNEAISTYASADYRLGDMNAITAGLKYGHRMQNGHTWSIRAEYYQQDPSNSGFDNIGVLASQNLYPSVKAFILQFGYQF